MVIKIAGMVIGLVLSIFVLFRIVDKYHRSPAHPLIGFFLNSRLRYWMQRPVKVIRRSKIKQDMTVVDLGCGSGAFTSLLARAVGEGGNVYAVDIQSEMLAQLKNKLAKTENLRRGKIHILLANASQLPFQNNSVDLVFMVAALPEISIRREALREIRRILKVEGTMAVTEFLVDSDYPLRSTTIRLAQQEGFVLDSDSGNFWNYTVIFKKGQ